MQSVVPLSAFPNSVSFQPATNIEVVFTKQLKLAVQDVHLLASEINLAWGLPQQCA